MFANECSGMFRVYVVVVTAFALLLNSCATPAVSTQAIDVTMRSSHKTEKGEILHVYLLNGQHWLLREVNANDSSRVLCGQCNTHPGDAALAQQWEAPVNISYADIRKLEIQHIDKAAELRLAVMGFAGSVGFLACIIYMFSHPIGTWTGIH